MARLSAHERCSVSSELRHSIKLASHDIVQGLCFQIHQQGPTLAIYTRGDQGLIMFGMPVFSHEQTLTKAENHLRMIVGSLLQHGPASFKLSHFDPGANQELNLLKKLGFDLRPCHSKNQSVSKYPPRS